MILPVLLFGGINNKSRNSNILEVKQSAVKQTIEFPKALK
jgi:hypothetical protein